MVDKRKSGGANPALRATEERQAKRRLLQEVSSLLRFPLPLPLPQFSPQPSPTPSASICKLATEKHPRHHLCHHGESLLASGITV